MTLKKSIAIQRNWGKARLVAALATLEQLSKGPIGWASKDREEILNCPTTHEERRKLEQAAVIVEDVLDKWKDEETKAKAIANDYMYQLKKRSKLIPLSREDNEYGR